MKGLDSKLRRELKTDDWISNYQQPRWNKPGWDGGRRKILLRVGAAVLIFMLFLALKGTSKPWAVAARENLQHVLTTEWDYQPAMERAVQYGLKVANMDWPYFSNPQPVISTPPKDGTGGLLPFPVSGRVVRDYGMTIDPIDNIESFHSGIDIAAPVGTVVRVVQDGKVKRTGDSHVLGRYIMIEHGQGVFTLYGGLSRSSVVEGQQVQAGQAVGEVGNAGDIPGGGLHFEIRENGKLVDPMTRLQVNSGGGVGS
ncbi:MAG: M23 family metallopeptidase [Desulfotomaculaceae bacterium]|nr:M23 family metallopeptidase [Desulfotomaculaceae bacterium]